MTDADHEREWKAALAALRGRVAELEAENVDLEAVNVVLKNMLRKIMQIIDLPDRLPNRIYEIAQEADDALAALAKGKGGLS